ncbi:MAG: class I SAM-dependent methyltransferase [Patescibacteria group bacterium]|nr:class I SAM-dependent methyltransferase [Patescibacteria group bacterium]
MQKKDFYNLNIGENNIQTGGFYLEKLYFILRTVGSKKRVLDIGCNDGYVGEKLLARENDVYGIDISEKELKIAGKKGLKVKNIDVENQELPYASGFFDVVILADIIEHVFDTDMLLKKCSRVLKRGGRLIVTTPNIASFGRRLMLLFGISPFAEYSLELPTNGLPSVGHIRYYTSATLKNQLQHNGFKDIKIEGDKINFGIFKSKSLGKFLPSLSIMLMASCTK